MSTTPKQCGVLRSPHYPKGATLVTINAKNASTPSMESITVVLLAPPPSSVDGWLLKRSVFTIVGSRSIRASDDTTIALELHLQRTAQLPTSSVLEECSSTELMRALLKRWLGYLKALWRSTHTAVSYTHLRAHETGRKLVCRLLLE